MEPRLVQHQSQKLVLSPQIRQYLKLLQMPLAELSQAIEIELTENPLLEEKSSESSSEEISLPGAESVLPAKDTNEVRVGESFDHLRQLDENFQESQDYPDMAAPDTRALQKRKDFQETLAAKVEGLSDFLLWQVRCLDLSDAEKMIAEQIIGNIDENGYLQSTTEEIALTCQASVDAVEEVLVQLQELDPPGIAARNLQEALRLQLERKGPEAALAHRIVVDHFDALKKKDLHLLAKHLKANPEEIQEAAVMIGHLEPRPGRIFYAETSQAVIPDAIISFAEDGEENTKLKIELPDEAIPTLRISSHYRRLLLDKNTDEKTRAFVREKLQAATNFVKALALRKSTLRGITEEILVQQKEFFTNGYSHLRPLRLKDVSQSLGIHESTVSRAIHGKYISTPQGTIPYKSFFSNKMDSTSGVEESQKSIMEKIRHLVQKENPKRPLSDQAIVKQLQQDGITIARRTVAKYRDLLKILPSHLRKK